MARVVIQIRGIDQALWRRVRAYGVRRNWSSAHTAELFLQFALAAMATSDDVADYTEPAPAAPSITKPWEWGYGG